MNKNILQRQLYTFTKKYRERISREYAKQHNYTVKAGPFIGLKLAKNEFWSCGDLGCKVAGHYEYQIQDLIVKLQIQNRKKYLINIGGADGFFSVGSVYNNLFDHCFVFEESYVGQKAIKECAKRNHMDKKISVFGKVENKSFLSSLPKKIDLKDCFILCDIEGDEYSVFDKNNLFKVKDCNIIIEIHDQNSELTKLKKKFSNLVNSYFLITIINSKIKDVSNDESLSFLNDIDRNLILSEGRSKLGEWWNFKPRN